MAQATELQRRHDARIDGHHSPLTGLSYSKEEIRLWRWVDSPVDNGIAQIVADFTGLNAVQRNVVRDRLTLDDFYVLLAFARRCALSSLRTRTTNKIELAFTAIAMIELARVDWRDVLVAIRLVRYASQRLNAPLADLVNQSVQMAEAKTAEALSRDQTFPTELTASCGYLEVVTSEGISLFSSDQKRFSPKANLTESAFAVAVALEANGYHIDDVTVAKDLPLIWLNGNNGSAIAKMVRKFSGCVSLSGVPRADPEPMSSGQSLLIFLAEAASEREAKEVALAAEKASNPLSTQIGIASGQVCAMIVQHSWMADTPPLEDTHSLERLRPVFERVLG